MNTARYPTAAYVHIPFCVSKCHYCDFSSYPGMESLYVPYITALVREVRRTAEAVRAKATPALDSVYVGGGTPTVLGADALAAIVAALEEGFRLAPGAEVTVEANPGTVDESKLAQLRAAKFNRISLGVQSLDQAFLSRIGRAHTALQAVQAYEAARRAGFANIGIDLIYALPGQTLSHWRKTLDAAVRLKPEHLSLYELTIEEGTLFSKLCARGALDLPGEDVQIAMYEMAIERLTSAGYEHYEVSNFARPGFRSRHNQTYWRNDPYYGFGAGATSYVGGDRTRRIADPRDYINAIESGSDAAEFSERLNGRARLAEIVTLGLRMLDGVDVERIRRETGADVRQEFSAEIERLQERGLLQRADGHLKVTHKGLLLLDDVAQELLG